MPNNYANEPNRSRAEDIIQSILDAVSYNEEAQSRIEYLLIQLKNIIEQGGGGGVTSYDGLTGHPKIDNHELVSGNNSSSDLGLQTKIDSSNKLSADLITNGSTYIIPTATDKTNWDAKADASDVNTALSGKVDKISGKGLSTNDYTDAEKTKLDGIAVNANKTIVDSSLNGNSTNPVQNRVITEALVTKQDNITDLSTIRSGASAGATAVQPATLNAYQPKIDSSNKLSANLISYDSAHRDVSDTEKSTWNSKQTALSSAQLNAVNSGIDSAKVEQISANQEEIARLVDELPKNVLNITKQSVKTENTAGSWNGDTYTRNGMNITINDDMTFTVNGEATDSFSFVLKKHNLGGLQGFILSGGNSDNNKVSVLMQMQENPWTNLAQDYGTGVTIAQYDDAKSVAVSIYFSSGATADNLVIKPMVCSDNSWSYSHEFVPYAPSNAELYKMLQEL